MDDEGKLALWENEPDIDYYKIAVLPPSKDDEGKLALWENEPDIDYYKIAVLPPSKDDEGKIALWENEPDIDYYKIAVLPPSKDDEGKIALWETEPDIDYYKIAVWAPDVDDPLPGAVPPPLIQKMGPFPPNPNPYCPLPFETLLFYKILMHQLTIEATAKEHGSRWDHQWAHWAKGTKSSFTGITIAHTRASASDFDPSKYEVTKEESEAFSNRDHGAAGQKSRDDRFELFDKFSRYDPYTALLVLAEPSRPVYLCPFAPIPEPFVVHGKEEKRIIKGNGHLATSGTTSIGGKNTAAATADAQDSDHNLISSASSNAMVFRGGSESLAYGNSDRQFFNKKPKVCIGPQCLPTKRRIV